MKVRIAAIGREKSSSPTKLLTDIFLKRLPWEVTIKELEVKKKLPPDTLKIQEAELLLQAALPNSIYVVLDENGKQQSSPQFAETLCNWKDRGNSNITFFIGGAHGHGEAIRQKADLLLSLGKMTWPHMLIRPILTEQLYRAYTIISGHPYHKP